jgi:hypothetical protein
MRERSRERADSTQNLEMRAIYLDSEQRWLKLAASYEATARLTHEEALVEHPLRTQLRLVKSHSLRVSSLLPDSAVRPSEEKATELTGSSCPKKVRISLPVATSHSLSRLIVTSIA